MLQEITCFCLAGVFKLPGTDNTEHCKEPTLQTTEDGHIPSKYALPSTIDMNEEMD